MSTVVFTLLRDNSTSNEITFVGNQNYRLQFYVIPLLNIHQYILTSFKGLAVEREKRKDEKEKRKDEKEKRKDEKERKKEESDRKRETRKKNNRKESEMK